MCTASVGVLALGSASPAFATSPAPAIDVVQLASDQVTPVGATIVGETADSSESPAVPCELLALAASCGLRQTAYFSVALNSTPSADVVVELAVSDATIALASAGVNFVTFQQPSGTSPGDYLLEFTPSDAQVPVVIAVTAETVCGGYTPSIQMSVGPGSAPEYLDAPPVTLPVGVDPGASPCSVALTTSSDPVNPNQAVTYVATTVSPPQTVAFGGGSQTPVSEGIVTFSVDGAAIPSCDAIAVNAVGQASCTQTYSTEGNHVVSASYSSGGRDSLPLPAPGVPKYPDATSLPLGETVANCGRSPQGCNLKDADLTNANLEGTDFQGANLKGADLAGADLSGATLQGDNLSSADLAGAELIGANLQGANLQDVNASNADLAGADLQGDNLSGATFAGADLEDANLSGANLSGVNFSGANMSDTNVRGSNLRDADLATASLAGAVMKGTNLTGVVWSDTTCPDGTSSDNDGGTCANDS
jgi:uncharacterized protein YjbI with pentapeptide repeats